MTIMLSLVMRDRRNSGEDVDCLVHGENKLPFRTAKVKIYPLAKPQVES